VSNLPTPDKSPTSHPTPFRRLTIAFSLVFSLASSIAALPWSAHIGMAQTIAVQGGKIIPIVGQPVEQGTILIRDGKIVAIGTDIEIPVDARIVDASGKVVMPGFIEAHSAEGMSQANETNPNVPYVSVLDTIDPLRSYFDEARRNGITSVSIVPGNSTMIGGQTAVIKTGEIFLDAMILERVGGMKISLSPVSGVSRMGHLAALRKELTDAYKLAYPAAKSEIKNEPKQATPATEKEEEGETGSAEPNENRRRRGRPNPDQGTDSGNGQPEQKPAPDEKDEPAQNDEKGDSKKPAAVEISPYQQPLVDLVLGKMKAFIHCEVPMDVNHALSLIEEFKLQPILVLGRGCYKNAEAIAASGYPIVLDADLVFWERDPRTNSDKQVSLIEAFQAVQAPLAFSVARASSETIGRNFLWYQAATAVKYGMDRQRALESLTIGPARMLGVDPFVGSLEPGKDGDLLILSGDPLNVTTWVEMTIIDGKIVYDRSNDPKLRILLEGTK
jgi:hypothetical protein